ncbi:hypothetical protein [Planococcus lenghuensis]|nr:hypothetical protein [Planococcus lenghuensis]
MNEYYEIVTYELPTSRSIRIVHRTLNKLAVALDGNVHPKAAIYSD